MSNESLPDMSKKLRPYDHEPVCKPRQLSDLNDDGESDADDSSRIGNVDCVNAENARLWKRMLRVFTVKTQTKFLRSYRRVCKA